MVKLLIIQTSPKHTGSTFLVNALYGIIPELSDKKVLCEFFTNCNEIDDKLPSDRCATWLREHQEAWYTMLNTYRSASQHGAEVLPAADIQAISELLRKMSAISAPVE